MSTWPLRVRLAVVFTAASAAVLAAVGAILYLSIKSSLNEQIAEHPATRLDAIGDRNEVLTSLLVLMLIVGPLALLLAAFAGYRLAGAALRPGRVDAARGGGDLLRDVRRAAPGAAVARRVRRLGETLNEMLERLDAGAASRAPLRRRREPRAADAAGAPRTELELALRGRRSPEEHEAALRSVAEEVERLIRLAGGPARARDLRARPSSSWSGSEVGELLDGVARRFAASAGAAERRRLAAAELAAIASGSSRRSAASSTTRSPRRAALSGSKPARAGDDAIFRVTDDGAGFPADFLAACVRALRRARTRRGRSGGAGLGLAIVARRRAAPTAARRPAPEPPGRRCRGDDLDPGSVRAMSIDPRVDIGHVHLKVADIERALGFYVGVLGFELQQRMGDQAAFISAGDYHHHIGLNTWESRGGSAAPARLDRPLPHRDPLSRPRAARRRAAPARRGRDPAHRRLRPRRQRGALPERPGRQRRRALPRPAARGVAARPGRRRRDDEHPARRRSAARARRRTCLGATWKARPPRRPSAASTSSSAGARGDRRGAARRLRLDRRRPGEALHRLARRRRPGRALRLREGLGPLGRAPPRGLGGAQLAPLAKRESESGCRGPPCVASTRVHGRDFTAVNARFGRHACAVQLGTWRKPSSSSNR